MGSYVPSTQAQREQMLRAVGLENIMDLYRDVPEQMLLRKPLNIPDGMSELEASRAVSAMAAENRTYATVLRGAGAYDHYIHRQIYPCQGGVPHGLHPLSGGNEPGSAAIHLRVSDHDL